MLHYFKAYLDNKIILCCLNTFYRVNINLQTSLTHLVFLPEKY